MKKVQKVSLVLRAILIVLIGVSLFACDKEDDEEGQEVSQEVSVVVKVVVENENQSTLVSLPGDASLIIPPGAALSGTTVTLQRLDPTLAPELPDWTEKATVLYEINSDKPFQAQVTLRFPLPKSEQISLLGCYRDGQWEVLAFRVEDGQAVIEVEELSWFSWLNAKVSWFSEKIVDFLTLRWLEEKPSCSFSEETIEIDDSESKGFVLGCAWIDNDKVEITIWNTAPIHLEVYPDPPRMDVELRQQTGIYQIGDVAILSPRSSAEWVAPLVPGESITFEAYFSDRAAAVFVGDLIPYGRLARGLIEGSLFARNGREMGWGDIKGLLIIPAFAEFSKTMGEIEAKYILESTRISFTLSTSEDANKLTGFVIDQYGEAVENAAVWLTNFTLRIGFSEGELGYSKTDQAGYFEMDITSIPEADYTFRIRKGEDHSHWYALNRTDLYEPYDKEISITKETKAEGIFLGTITFHKWYRIIGKVVDNSGAPYKVYWGVYKIGSSTPSSQDWSDEIRTCPLAEGVYVLKLWAHPIGTRLPEKPIGWESTEKKIVISGNDVNLGKIVIPR